MLGFYWTTDKQRSAAQRRLGNVVRRLKMTFIARHILSWLLFIGVLTGIGGLAARLNDGADAQNSLAIVVGLVAGLMVMLRYGLRPVESLSQWRWQSWLARGWPGLGKVWGGPRAEADRASQPSFELRMAEKRSTRPTEPASDPSRPRVSLKSRLAIVGTEIRARSERLSDTRRLAWVPWALASAAGLAVIGLIGLSAPQIEDLVTSALAPTPPRIVEGTAQVVGPGTLRLGAYTVQLQGIAAPEADRRCENARGRDWACGRAADRAFRRLVNGKRIRCEIPASVTEGTVTARCFRRQSDLAEGLVRQGYASPDGGAGRLYRLAEAEAKQTRRGLWR